MSKDNFRSLKNKEKLALTLEGGGARGAYQVGALKALYDAGFNFDAVVGTSIGSIIAAYIAQGDFDKLYEMWHTMSFRDLLNLDNEMMKNFLDINLDRKTVRYMSRMFAESIKNGGLDVTQERKILNKDIDEAKIRKSKVKFGLVTMCVSDVKGRELFIEDIPDGKLIDFLMASSNLPIFKRVVIDNKKYLDGGAWDNCPVHMLEEKGYEDAVVIRSYKNIRIRAYRKILKRGKIKLHMIAPVDTLPSILNFDKENLDYQIKLGYLDVKKRLEGLDGIRYYIIPFNKKNIVSMFRNNDKRCIDACISKYHVKLNDYENTFETIIEKIWVKTKNKDLDDIKDKFVSILEEICLINKVDNLKVYDIEELIDIVKKCKKFQTKNIDFKWFVNMM